MVTKNHIICISIFALILFTGCNTGGKPPANNSDLVTLKIETSKTGDIPEGAIVKGSIEGTPQSGLIRKNIEITVPGSVELKVKPSGNGIVVHFPEEGFEIEYVKFKTYADGKELEHIYQCNGDEIFLEFRI